MKSSADHIMEAGEGRASPGRERGRSFGVLWLLREEPHGGRQGTGHCGEGKNLKMFFWPNEDLLGEELGLHFLENKNRFALQQEEV